MFEKGKYVTCCTAGAGTRRLGMAAKARTVAQPAPARFHDTIADIAPRRSHPLRTRTSIDGDRVRSSWVDRGAPGAVLAGTASMSRLNPAEQGTAVPTRRGTDPRASSGRRTESGSPRRAFHDARSHPRKARRPQGDARQSASEHPIIMRTVSVDGTGQCGRMCCEVCLDLPGALGTVGSQCTSHRRRDAFHRLRDLRPPHPSPLTPCMSACAAAPAPRRGTGVRHGRSARIPRVAIESNNRRAKRVQSQVGTARRVLPVF